VTAVVAILAAVAIVAGANRAAPRPPAASSSPASPTGLAPSGLEPSALAPSALPPSGSAAAVAGDHGYLVSLTELQARAAAAANGAQPEAAALADLLAWVPGALNGKPDPADPLRIDGTTGPFVDDSATAYGLALAWGATGDQRDAVAARAYVMAWAETTRTLVGACPGDGNCQTSLIVSRTAPGFAFAVDLLRTSGVFSEPDLTVFEDWLRAVILPAASERTNNWGDAGTFLRVVATDAIGDDAGFTAAIDAWRTQLDLVAADGHIPEEVRRGSAGLSYTQEALLYKLAVARIAERRGIDLWDYQGACGGSLHGAIDYAARYELAPAAWPWQSHVDVPTAGPGWELAYAHWPEPAIATILAAVRPLGFTGHSAVRWTTLTNGVPFGG
jgi:hypothetical protein